MSNHADVIIIGAGGGGSVVAKELGEKGLKVVLLEAGPWYGHKKWPHPNSGAGASSANDPEDLSQELLADSFTAYEDEMNDTISGKLRWGPADRSRPPWARSIAQEGFGWQVSGVGGTTLHYFGNSPRAFPLAVDNHWPISYRELIPYYEQVEATLPVHPAPMTQKEELFFFGAKKAGWSLLKTLNVTSPGFRPQPNAILAPDSNINKPSFNFDGHNEGCTLCGHCINGCHIGPTVDKTAKRSTLVSYIPLALKTRAVEVRPNAFVIKILTANSKTGLRAAGVRFRNTWSGEIGELWAKVIVLAGGSIETPRLWLNSDLPQNPWVGRGLTNHWFDCVSGIFDEKVLLRILGLSNIKPYVGQNSAARFDYPGLGVIQGVGLSPGLSASLLYTLSSKGYNFLNKPDLTAPWDMEGRVIGQQLKAVMQDYPRTLSVLIFTDDEVNQQNGITLHPTLRDEHGRIPLIKYQPGKKDSQKRAKLAVIAAEILKHAGAKTIIRANCIPGFFAHVESTMRMGYVTDQAGEALQVERLYIADNSIHFNSLGGPNPTLTTQALATRTAEKIAIKYFT